MTSMEIERVELVLSPQPAPMAVKARGMEDQSITSLAQSHTDTMVNKTATCIDHYSWHKCVAVAAHGVYDNSTADLLSYNHNDNGNDAEYTVKIRVTVAAKLHHYIIHTVSQ